MFMQLHVLHSIPSVHSFLSYRLPVAHAAVAAVGLVLRGFQVHVRCVDWKPCSEAQQPPRTPQHRLEWLLLASAIKRQCFGTHDLRCALLEQPADASSSLLGAHWPNDPHHDDPRQENPNRH